MSRGVNRVFIIGNCGKDPETSYGANGNAVTKISVATSEKWKDKQTGQPQEHTEWHRIVFFGKLAEIAGEYLKKGSKVYVEGSLKTNKWQDQQGQDRYSTDIIASEMQMLDSRDGGGQQPSQNAPQAQQSAQQPQQDPPQQGYQQPAQNPQQQGQPQQQQNNQQAPVAAPVQHPPGGGVDDFDDDIPF